MSNPQEIALELLNRFMTELTEIVEKAEREGDFDVSRERLQRWKKRAVEEIGKDISSIEAENLEKKRKASFLMGQPLRNLVDEVDMYRGFLMALGEEVKDHPDSTLLVMKKKMDKQETAPTQSELSKNVFIVHGHDELNLLRLKDLLKERWHINPIVLQKEPGKGRTLVEKFEQEAQPASYAIALFTPDDVVNKDKDTYLQARPNAIFEVGWFFGRLGRDRVCLLIQEGTEVLSEYKVDPFVNTLKR